MRKTGNKVLFALLAGAALIFAGCGQQGTGDTGGTGGGAVTDVGVALVDDGDAGAVGLETVKVTVNEDAQVKKVELFIDGQKVNEVTTASLQPQALEYTLSFDSAKLGGDGQPLWMNGDHDLKVVVTDAQGGTASKQITVPFSNADYVRRLVVSQSDNPKAPVSVSGTDWYGNGDVKVTIDIVNYSGATYTVDPTTLQLIATGGVGPKVLDDPAYTTPLYLVATAGSMSAVNGEAAVQFAKSANTGVETTINIQLLDSSTTPQVVAQTTFGLDNQAPTGTPDVQYRVFPATAFANLSGASTSVYVNESALFRGTGASDGGVGGITYYVEFVLGLTSHEVELKPAPDAGISVSGLTNGAAYDVQVAAVEDALGNKNDFGGTPVTVVTGLLVPAYGEVSASGIDVTDSANAGTGTVTLNAVTTNTTSGAPNTYAYLGYKIGNKVVVTTSTSLPALYGADYVLLVYDDAGNFRVYDLAVTINQASPDTTGPALTVSPSVSTVAPSTAFTVTGAADDATAISVLSSIWSEGGYQFFDVPVTATITSGTYSASVTSPGYRTSLSLLALGRDSAGNLGYAEGSVNVQ